MNTKELGELGEKIARDYLEKKGYKILAKNFKRKWGEIDIVALPPRRKIFSKKSIAFVEVKTLQKSNSKKFYPEDEVDWKKKKQLRKMAQIYLSVNKIPLDSPWQIDIIAVEISPDFKEAPKENKFPTGQVKIRHYKNAIEDEY